MVTDDFYKSTFWTKDDSQYSISIRIMSLFEAIEDVRTCSNAYAVWSPLTLLPSFLTMNGASWPAAFLESMICLDKLTSNAPPFDLGSTARSKLFLEGSDSILTNAPSSILYLIGTVFHSL